MKILKQIVEPNKTSSLFPLPTWGRWLILAAVFVLGFGIRIYDLKDPPLDFHATRQLRSAIISRAIYYDLDQSVDPNLKSQAQRLASLEEYEPPILETIVGGTYALLNQENFWISRIYNALFWCIGGAAIYFLGSQFVSFGALIVGLAFYFFLPFSVIASRSFQPDPWMVMWVLLAACAIYRWTEEQNWKWTVISGVVAGIAILVKSVAAFYLAGIMAAVFLGAVGFRKFFKSWQPWVIGAISLLPTLSYYLLFQSGRTSDFLSFWVVSLSGLLLKTEFYADWLAMVKGLMGLMTFLIAVLGALAAPKKFKPFLIGGWIGYVLYGLVFPYQYTTHEYYHLPLVALVALSLFPVVELLIEKLSDQSWVWRLGAVGIIAFASVYSLWVSRSILYASSYENEPVSWQRVGEAIPEDGSFVSLTADYGMRLRYYGWRIMSAEWPTTGDLNLFSLAGSDPLDYQTYFEEFVAGKDYFVVTAFSQLEAQPQLKDLLTTHYPVFAEGDGYLIYDLKSPINP